MRRTVELNKLNIAKNDSGICVSELSIQYGMIKSNDIGNIET